MSSDLLKSIVKDLGDKVALTNVAHDGKHSAQYAGTIDTGCYILNAQLSGSIYGGMPDNKILGIAGESSAGKTFFALSIVKQFLDYDSNRIVFYYDTEAAVTKEMLESRGIDTARVAIIEPLTVQKFRTHVLKAIERLEQVPKDECPRILFVLDSLGNLPSEKEADDAVDDKDVRDMTKAQLLKSTFRLIGQKLARNRFPLIVTNHVYANIGGYGPAKVMSGGGGLRYNADQIIFISKAKDVDGKEILGNIITSKTDKNRITKENTEVEMRLSYRTGLDRHYGLLDLAEKYGILKKVSTRYEMPDGTLQFGKTINNDPEKFWTKELLDKVDEAAAKEFHYGENEIPVFENEE